MKPVSSKSVALWKIHQISLMWASKCTRWWLLHVHHWHEWVSTIRLCHLLPKMSEPDFGLCDRLLKSPESTLSLAQCTLWLAPTHCPPVHNNEGLAGWMYGWSQTRAVCYIFLDLQHVVSTSRIFHSLLCTFILPVFLYFKVLTRFSCFSVHHVSDQTHLDNLEHKG